MSNKQVNILIIDDDMVDVQCMKRGFKKLKIANPIYHAKDGIEGLEILRGENEAQQIPYPLYDIA